MKYEQPTKQYTFSRMPLNPYQGHTVCSIDDWTTQQDYQCYNITCEWAHIAKRHKECKRGKKESQRPYCTVASTSQKKRCKH